MTGRGFLKKAKKVVSRATCSRGESSSRSESPSTAPHPDDPDEPTICENAQQPSTQSEPQSDQGVWLIGEDGRTIRRRGRTTCADIQSLPPGTRVLIEINSNGIPCNIPESVLLGSYMGVIARDPVLAPLSFPDWRHKGLDSFKKKMLAEVESKFEFPKHIRHWILQAIGVKWRNHKTSLKAEFWDSRPIGEIMENVPDGVDAVQWSLLVTQWSQPHEQERAARNTENAKKQTCPHTMGRSSSVRRQKETALQDRLLLWRVNRLHKDGSWSSDDARSRWEQACELLAAEGLAPEDGNIEANERVFSLIMGPEHPGRVRTQGFGVTPTRFFPQSSHMSTEGSGSSSFAQVARLEGEIQSLRSEVAQMGAVQSEMREFMQRMQSHFPPPGGSHMGENNQSSD